MEKQVLPITAESKLTKSQKKTYGPAKYSKDGHSYQIKAEVRWDDECGNGHNSFSITSDVWLCDVKGNRVQWASGGCQHDLVAVHFPELAPFIKWHLSSSDGPMHYIANTVYLAGDRDHWGKRKGEPRSWEWFLQFGKNPIKHKLRGSFAKFLMDNQKGVAGPFDFEVLRFDHESKPGDSYKFGPKFTFGGYGSKWHECPFDSEQEALDFLYALQHCEPEFVQVPTAWGEGKARELDAARRAAVWPEATDAELTAPDLAERLKARLPGLLAEMRKDIESLGFVW